MRLELRGITKIFDPLVANDHMDLAIEPGEVHALLGENGTGKSILMNALYGLYKPDAGEILIDGKSVTFKDPEDAVAAGIRVVYQHFILVPVFTATESVALGYEPAKGVGILDLNSVRKKVRELLTKFSFDTNPSSLIEDLPVDAQQRVEVTRALSREAKTLILNRPTAVLIPRETGELIRIMRQLKASGTSIMFVTRKLREVKAAAEEVTVIRRGKVVRYAKPEFTDSELTAVVVGHEVKLTVKKAEPELGNVVSEMKQAMATDKTGQVKLDHIDLEAHSGEILAIAGARGNSQTELCRTILGLRPLVGSSTNLTGEGLSRPGMRTRLGWQLGYVPEDRSTDGMITSFSITEDMILDQYDRPPLTTGINIYPKVMAEDAEKLREECGVWITSTSDAISTLSGGDQQKAILTRELSRPLRLLVASQPAHGLDVSSIEFVHKRIAGQRDAGTEVILASTEPDEVMSLADRIAVVYRGKVIGIVPPNTSRGALGLMMAKVPLEEQESTK